jgi:hypothetical protein
VRGIYKVLAEQPVWKRQLGRSGLRWAYNNEICLHEVECVCLDWIDLSQNRYKWRTLVIAVMNLKLP